MWRKVTLHLTVILKQRGSMEAMKEHVTKTICRGIRKIGATI